MATPGVDGAVSSRQKSQNVLVSSCSTSFKPSTYFEPDFNWLLGMLFGRRMLHAAHKFHFLHDSQFGSRPGRQALSAVLMKQLSYEVCRLTRTPFASFDNDAKSCYDRIIVSMVMILRQRLGMPLTSCLMAALCLRYARYYIKTKFGLSTSIYKANSLIWVFFCRKFWVDIAGFPICKQDRQILFNVLHIYVLLTD